MKFTTLIHIVGPQGCGKSTLADWIAAGLPAGRAVQLQADQVIGVSNAELRRRFPGRLVLVEAERRQCRHADLGAGDMVLTIERAAPAAANTEASHAA